MAAIWGQVAAPASTEDRGTGFTNNAPVDAEGETGGGTRGSDPFLLSAAGEGTEVQLQATMNPQIQSQSVTNPTPLPGWGGGSIQEEERGHREPSYPSYPNTNAEPLQQAHLTPYPPPEAAHRAPLHTAQPRQSSFGSRPASSSTSIPQRIPSFTDHQQQQPAGDNRREHLHRPPVPTPLPAAPLPGYPLMPAAPPARGGTHAPAEELWQRGMPARTDAFPPPHQSSAPGIFDSFPPYQQTFGEGSGGGPRRSKPNMNMGGGMQMLRERQPVGGGDSMRGPPHAHFHNSRPSHMHVGSGSMNTHHTNNAFTGPTQQQRSSINRYTPHGGPPSSGVRGAFQAGAGSPWMMNDSGSIGPSGVPPPHSSSTLGRPSPTSAEEGEDDDLSLPTTEKVLWIPAHQVPRLVGQHGGCIQEFENRSGATLRYGRAADTQGLKTLTIRGQLAQVEAAEDLVLNKLASWAAREAGGPARSALWVPDLVVGQLIGRGGRNVAELQLSSGVVIQVDHPGDVSAVTTGYICESLALTHCTSDVAQYVKAIQVRQLRGAREEKEN
uniref:K Homology domain-containing protein n=1 Tax=Chromera velia CCMP2878 TaxID=1169474 RepID=A0A0G4I5K8_9ALVE|eukprot:Cvel_11195.t1-p1 / transcript=Cvel_11195.t1 / gene=Cvel_11195 / organism=Chromera_velia_CCMP2878 / gene_product=Deneddylase, putative / transcript_product=Deneddylase, putative / location=Cvel_scaffold696:383-2035(-) / protein_length=551 / sequence_SO=supercontig / SO=protein_coding / is_pseudo=false